MLLPYIHLHLIKLFTVNKLNMTSKKNTKDWREKIKEMNDANPQENDSLELGDSWRGMPRRTEVLANRSNNNLYRRHLDPGMQSAENLYNVIMVKRSTQESTNGQANQKTKVSSTENVVVPVQSSNTPNNIATEEVSPETFEDSPALNFTEFICTNNKNNIQITSTPYVALRKADLNKLPTNDHIMPPEVPATPKILLRRTSFQHRNNESYSTPRSSRVSMNLDNSQLVSQSSREPEREQHVDIIPENNKLPNCSQIRSAVVSSTVNSQENLMTSDEDSNEQPIFRKPPDKVQIRNPQIDPISSENTVTNEVRSQMCTLQNERQLSTDQASNPTQNAKQKQGSHCEVGVSTKEYMELMQARGSNTQQSESSTASSTRRKLYKKGDSIHEDEWVEPNIVASQKVSDALFDQLRSEQPVASQDKGTSHLSTGKEPIVPSTSHPLKEKAIIHQGITNSLNDSIHEEMDEFQNDVIIQPNNDRIETRSPKKNRRPHLRSATRILTIEERTNKKETEQLLDKSRKPPIHFKTPINVEQSGSKAKVIIKTSNVAKKNQLKKKSKKRAPFSKQSRIHYEADSNEQTIGNPVNTEISEELLTTKSLRLPSPNTPVDNEQGDLQPITVDQPCDDVDANENRKSPIPSNDLPVESEQDKFETSDIQPNNQVETEKNKSHKRLVLSESEQIDFEKKRGGRPPKVSNKSKKHPPSSTQSQMHIEPKLKFSKRINAEVDEKELSRKRPSSNEPVVEPVAIDDELHTERLSNKSRERPPPSSDMSDESQQDVFETSDIQPNNEVVERESESRETKRNAKKQPLHVDGPPAKKSGRVPRSTRQRIDSENGKSNDEFGETKRNAKKRPLHVDGPPAKKSGRVPRSTRKRIDSEDGESNDESGEDKVPKPKKKYKPKHKYEYIEEKYDVLKEREIVPGTRHSTRTRRLPIAATPIIKLLEEIELKKKHPVRPPRTLPKRKKTVPSTSEASHGDEEFDELREGVIITPNEEEFREEAFPPRKKKRPNETEHSTSWLNILNGEHIPMKSFEFQGVHIGNGFTTVQSRNVKTHYLPAFTLRQSFGWMSLDPNSTKTASRTVNELWLTVMSGTVDLSINKETQTLTTGTVARIYINKKYKLINRTDHQTLIFFSQETEEEEARNVD